MKRIAFSLNDISSLALALLISLGPTGRSWLLAAVGGLAGQGGFGFGTVHGWSRLAVLCPLCWGGRTRLEEPIVIPISVGVQKGLSCSTVKFLEKGRPGCVFEQDNGIPLGLIFIGFKTNYLIS